MQDTNIKGTRDSRSIIGAASIPATWEQARAQLIQSGWPIDLGPLNPAGLKTKGTELNKENLLKDATAALYGLTAAAVPDDVLAKARTLITDAQTAANGRARVVTGSYVGTNNSLTSGVTLTFSAPPKLVAIGGASEGTGPLILVKGVCYAATTQYSSGTTSGWYETKEVTWSGNSVSFKGFEEWFMNATGKTYVYTAIL